MRYIALIKLSDDGKKRFAEADKLFTQTVEIVERARGKVLETYSVTGHYDFASVVDLRSGGSPRWEQPTPWRRTPAWHRTPMSLRRVESSLHGEDQVDYPVALDAYCRVAE